MHWPKNILRKIYRANKVSANSLAITAHVPHMDDFTFYLHSVPDQYVSGELRRDKIWEPFETEVFRRLCQPGDFVVDIGANIGWYSVIASHLVGVTGRVVSFEPDMANLGLLTKNVVKSGGTGKVDILNVALGDRNTHSQFFLSQSNLGDHHLFDDGEARNSIVVEVKTLDSLFAGCASQPTLVKSDTQGSEARIFRGADTLLAEGWRPVCILEFWPYGLTKSGDDPLEFWQYLLSLGYMIYELSEGNPKLVSLTEERLHRRMSSDISVESRRFINLLCFPHASARIEFVRDLLDPAIPQVSPS